MEVSVIREPKRCQTLFPSNRTQSVVVRESREHVSHVRPHFRVRARVSGAMCGEPQSAIRKTREESRALRPGQSEARSDTTPELRY